MGTTKSLGTKIKEAREAKKLTQKELADQLSLGSDKVISSWERDRTKPDYDSIVKICQILDISLNYLFGFNSDDYFDGISPIEVALIEDFRLLDEIGQSVVIYNLEAQKKRCAENHLDIDSELLSNTGIITKKELFLEKTNVQYESMKEKTKNLSKLKKTSYLSYEAIFAALCNRGYNGLISIADLVMIMHRAKVPSAKLYDDIEVVLMNSQFGVGQNQPQIAR